MRQPRVTRCLILMLAGVSAAASAQQTPTPAPAAAPYALYLRWGDRSPEYAFLSYSFGRLGVMGGTVSDPASGYDEQVVGAGLNLYTASGNGGGLYLMASRATDSWYAELYAFPTWTRGLLNVSGFAGAYAPLQPEGTTQWFVDPVTILVRANERLALGGSYSTYTVEGYAAKQGVGPTVQLTIPRGTVMLDVMRPIREYRSEARLTIQLAF